MYRFSYLRNYISYFILYFSACIYPYYIFLLNYYYYYYYYYCCCCCFRLRLRYRHRYRFRILQLHLSSMKMLLCDRININIGSIWISDHSRCCVFLEQSSTTSKQKWNSNARCRTPINNNEPLPASTYHPSSLLQNLSTSSILLQPYKTASNHLQAVDRGGT